MRRAHSGIVVIGSGSALCATDRVRLNIAVEDTAASAPDALSRSADGARSVQQTLHDEGVPRQLVRTTGVSVGPRWDNNSRITGYVARQSFSVVVHDVTQAGALLETLGRSVGNSFRVDQVELYAENTADARRAAQEAAFADALAQASALAEQAGRPLGTVGSITTMESNGMHEMYGGAVAVAAKFDSVAAGDVELTVRVQVAWEWADSTA